ncbi:MAG: hypothetical protein OXF32_11160 [Anaerolineaceae bacterium]|nr:hypothetical protein [Anaerolineaceae bacterium]
MMVAPESVVRSACPCCGVGCQMDLHLRDGPIYRVDAPFDSAADLQASLYTGQRPV